MFHAKKAGLWAASLLLAAGTAYAGQEPSPDMRHEQGQWQREDNTKQVDQNQVDQGKKLSKLDKDEIKQIQTVLQQKGLYRGQIDGDASPETLAALGAFQKSQGLFPNGFVDSRTAQALNVRVDEIQKVSGKDEAKDNDKNWKDEDKNEGAKFDVNQGTKLSKLNQADLRSLQQKLKDEDYYKGPIDGRMNEATIAALGVFQYKKDLDVTGRLDAKTMDKLDLHFASVQPVRGGEGYIQFSQLSHDQRVQVQQKLKDAGLYNGPIDGQLGAQTQAALRQFQEQHKLQASGRLDNQTAQALGIDVNEIQPVRGQDTDRDQYQQKDQGQVPQNQNH